MQPDELEGWMLKLADAATEDPHGHVFVMRQVLTKAYQRGFEDGHHAADKDDFVRREIERKAKAREDTP
ncbi:MAG: hypothetical protein JWO67_2041 [Streptosporangiaceae bacterium]|nr:hypothetical protein [Streptosporangiaceae bacterium]